MISSNYTSKAALRHAERQRLEIKIKALSFALWQSKKRHRELLGQMESQPPKQERPSVVGRPDAVNAIKRPRLPPTMIDDEKREHKRAYMRDYMRRRKALGDAFVFKQKQKRKKPQGLPPMTDEEKREYKLAYMRDYIRRRKAQKQTL